MTLSPLEKDPNTLSDQVTNKNCIVIIYTCYSWFSNTRVNQKHRRHGYGCKTEWKGQSPGQWDSMQLTKGGMWKGVR